MSHINISESYKKIPPKRMNRLKHYMRLSVIEGIIAQLHISINQAGSMFLTKFMIIFSATPFHLSIFSAIGQLSQLFQPIGALLTRKSRSRKRLTVLYLLFGRITPFFYGLLPFIFLDHKIILWFFLLLFFISMSMQAIGGNAWIAWMSDMIPLRIRARFISARSQYILIVAIIVGYIMSLFLDLYDSQHSFILKIKSFLGNNALYFSQNTIIYGFFAVFLFSVIMGLISNKLLLIQPERPKIIENEHYISLLFSPLKDKNFRRLLIYGFWWMLTIGIGAPFWTPFMIEKLKMSLTQIQIYIMINTIVSLAVMRLWGKIIDKFGNKTAMRFIIILGGFNPLIWLFLTSDNYWVVYIEALTSGIMWSGAGLVGFNFVLAIAPSRKRQIYSGIFGAFSGIATMITMILSGLLLPPRVTLFGLPLEPEQILFGIAGLARWTTEIPLSWIYEARSKPFCEVMRHLAFHIFQPLLLLITKLKKKFH